MDKIDPQAQKFAQETGMTEFAYYMAYGTPAGKLFVFLRDEHPDVLVSKEISRTGTSVVLFFDPKCEAHKLPGTMGENAIRDIKNLLTQRFVQVLQEQLGRSSEPETLFLLAPEVRIGEEKMCFDNCEIYFWLRRIRFTEEFVVTLILAFKHSLENKPAVITVNGHEMPLSFYGWGWRYV